MRGGTGHRQARDLRGEIASLAGIALLLAAGSARAVEPESPEDAAIVWTAPAGCPSASDLRAKVDALLAKSKEKAQLRGHIDASVTEDASAAKFRLKLVITSGAGASRERQLEGATCVEVTDAAAAVLALTSDEEAAAATNAALNPTPPKPELPAAPLPVPPMKAAPPPIAKPVTTRHHFEPTTTRGEADAAEPSTPLHLAWHVAALSGLDFATLPNGVAAGFGASGRVAIGAERLELRVMGWLPGRATTPSNTFGSNGAVLAADIALVSGAARFCHAGLFGPIDLGPCVGFEAGAFTAKSEKGTGTKLAPFAAPVASVLAAFRPTTGFAILVNVEGLVLLARPHFTEGSAELYRPPPAATRALIGLEARFE